MSCLSENSVRDKLVVIANISKFISRLLQGNVRSK